MQYFASLSNGVTAVSFLPSCDVSTSTSCYYVYYYNLTLLINHLFVALYKGYKNYQAVRQLLLLILNSNIAIPIYTFEGVVYTSLADLPPGTNVNLVTTVYVINQNQQQYVDAINRKIYRINQQLLACGIDYQIPQLSRTDVLLSTPVNRNNCYAFLAGGLFLFLTLGLECLATCS